MPRPGFIDGADDMLIDMEKIDMRTRGQLTERKRATIKRMVTKFGFSADWIARQLGLAADDVEHEISVLHSSSLRLR